MAEQPQVGTGTQSAPAATIPSISANQLRALAERADSRRGRTVFLVANPVGSPEPFDIVEGERERGGRTVVLTLRTDDEPPAFEPRQPEPICLSSQPPVELIEFPRQGLEICDAVFTSLVAVEKFVKPYYSRFRKGPDVQALRDGFASEPTVLAVAHVPDSIPSGARARETRLFALKTVAGRTEALSAQPIDDFVAEFLRR